MEELSKLVEESSDEVWLFADLFASLLMTIVVLVNAHSVAIKVNPTSSDGLEPPPTRLVFLISASQVKLDNDDEEMMVLADAIATLKSTKSNAEVVASSKNNGEELFEIFTALEDAEVGYQYSLKP